MFPIIEIRAVGNILPKFVWKGDRLIEDIITEFDTQRRIFHLTAKSPLNIRTNAELNELFLKHQPPYELCGMVKSLLTEHTADERCHMVVDVSKIVIDPMLVSEYMQKVKFLCDHYIYPDGLARYGYQITRITAMIGHQRYMQKEAPLFRNKMEAVKYIEELIEARKLGSQQNIGTK